LKSAAALCGVQPRSVGEPEEGQMKTEFAGTSGSGETRTRTGDTTIFSRVLYQLSYLAERGEG
jgi:hypothetical protein